MASDWRQRKVSEVCTGLFDGPHATPAESDTGPIFLRIENIERSGRLNFSAIRRINEADFPRWTRRVKPQEDDIVFSYEANLGLFCRVPAGFHGCLGRRLALVRPDKTRVVPAYLLYAFLSPTFQELLRQRTVLGSTVDRISLKEFPSYEIPLPPLAEQRAIANILGVLDDKIELNRRMNETLEGLARAIFQSWFVDFDPVRAQRDGLPPPALSPATAALFPDSFEDSELGKIPKGWEVKTLGECIGFRSGFSFKSQDWQDSGVPVVKIGSVKPGIIDLTQVSYVSASIAQQAARYQLSTGDMLIGMTGYVGEVGLVPPSDNPPLLNQRVGKFVMPKPGTASLGFWYCTTRQPEFRAFVEARSHGTAQANVSGEAIMEFPLVQPPDGILDEFNQTCRPMLDRILTNHGESRSLAAIRDALLPKLLSGEIRVAEAERLVEDAG